MCVIACKHFKDIGWVGSKNRDRNYKPEIVIKQSFRNGTERLFLYDKKTKYTEGVNEHGLAILSAAVAVKKDEKEGLKADAENKPSPDGFKIRQALYSKTPKEALEACIDMQLPGNTILFTKNEGYLLEATFEDDNKKDYVYKYIKLDKDKPVVRTNHGILITSGYNKEDDIESWESSVTRYKKALKGIKKCQNPLEMMDAIGDQSNDNYMLNPLRSTPSHGSNILKTTGQIMLIPSENTLHYRPLWCDMDFSTFSKINNDKSKCFYEVVSAKKLLKIKETKIMKNFKEFANAVLEGKFDVYEDIIVEDEQEIFSEEGKVTDKKSLTDYAMAVGEEAFGDDMDEKKIKDMVDNAIEEADDDGDTDWEAAAGIIAQSITGG